MSELLAARIAELETAEQDTQKLLGEALHYPAWDYATPFEDMRAVRLAERIVERVAELERKLVIAEGQAAYWQKLAK
jgi:hypothetical protein